ncbi:iron-sulfur cluster repair protein YtfE [Kangiella sediminilitoris]|uniref:Iron-sulfur cluster repair di-iron protein n=1 Tax=Kangiella sediminilitoris TaxID=1144748 RepID=A0A1B3B8Z6_9GAMM|nr:iron-sulfur cluster repair protein YtfE [Kangiella sediminilitoris]AOE49251.1 Iron-sulfur cluster repair di-iron protein [Kangiella sediminilitoris]
MNLLTLPLGQIARDIPGANDLFFEHGIDYSCSGKSTLGSSIEEMGLSPDNILEALQKLEARPPSEHELRNLSDEQLIDHILERYHVVHRQQIPELLQLADRVESVHKDHPDCPQGLTQHLHKMSQEMEAHMLKEEQILFPIIRQGMAHMANSPVAVMRMEHDDHSGSLRRLTLLTNNFQLPGDACNSWRSLYDNLKIFQQDLTNHIHTENNILFERIDNYLRGA